jgi:hypothetical protein
MRIISLVVVMSVFTAVCAFSADAAPAGAENEVLAIDEETAAKLAMVVSYHADYGCASGYEGLTYGKSDRIFVDSFELTSLDGGEKYYAITLYRGAEGEPDDFKAIRERTTPSGELMVRYAEKTGEGKYRFEPPPLDELKGAFFFGSMEEFLDYSSCVVPASTSQGFLLAFRQGISPYVYREPLAVHLLATDRGVDPSEVTVVRITPEFDYVCDVSGTLYVVRLGFFDANKTAEIIPYETGPESLAGTEEYEAVLPDLDVKARDEDIVFWLDTARRVEEKFGFGDGPSVAADSVNPVLMGRRFKVLYYAGRSETLIFDSRDRKAEPE